MAKSIRDVAAGLLTRLRLPLMIFAMLLGIALVAMPVVIRAVDDAVDKSLRHDIAWTGQHGRAELYSLTRALIAAQENSSAESRAEVALALDILLSRLNTWQTGAFGKFVEASPRRKALLDGISRQLHALESHVRQPDWAQIPPGLNREILSIENDITELASQAYDFYQHDLVNGSAELRFLNRVHNVITLSLIAIAALLILGLDASNRSLEQSYDVQRAIAQDNAYLAAFDPLTGLSNRKSFLASLETAIGEREPQQTIVVVAIDLDGFKPINDVLGHKAGDELLIEVANRLMRFRDAQERVCAARFGGDEFMVMLVLEAELPAIQNRVRLLHEALRAPLRIDDHFFSIDATMGLSLLRQGHLPAEQLVHRADLALTSGKMEGKGRRTLFDEAMLSRTLHRGRLEIELSEALLEQEIEPVYQPIVDLPSRTIIGVEALVRWRHPTRGLVLPSDFIPAAESSGKIIEIGRIMLERACRDATHFPEPISVSVNLSPVQLMRMDVAESVATALAHSGLAPHRLKLEITESVMLQDAKGARTLMQRLQALGVTVSLDDFGTGYSSLSYLRSFPFNELKIDRSFLSGIGEERQAAGIVQIMLMLARELNMNVVAEGIEDEAQAATLMALGCARGQGFLFGKPMNFMEICRLLRPGWSPGLGAVA